MRRIVKKKGIWDFSDYIEYLNSIKEFIPSSIRDFIVDENRYMFNVCNTLYDSQLIHIKLFSDTVKMVFISPCYNKIYEFIFKDILKLTMNYSPLKLESLLVHEFLIKKEGVYQYDFLFFNESEVKISCSQIFIHEKNEVPKYIRDMVGI